MDRETGRLDVNQINRQIYRHVSIIALFYQISQPPECGNQSRQDSQEFKGSA